MADDLDIHTSQATDASADDDDYDNSTLTVHISYRKTPYDLVFHPEDSVTDLFDEIEESFGIPSHNQKILVPKGPMLKMPLKDPDMSVATLQGKTLMLIGSAAADVEAVQKMSDKVAKRNAARMAHRFKAKAMPRRSNQAQTADDAKYTFLQVRPLQGLPRPERSQMLLMRLKGDPGIRAAMRKHKFTVSLLTEMEPLAHTQSTHEGTSRILGLNRNQGEVIELRLRTDAHDGYRDYKTIRNTLCHELAHNVHGPHDRKFWDLCHQIEREVNAADWKSGGHTIGESSRYAISGAADEDEAHEDDGGWTGGEFVLGGVESALPGSSVGLSRREILAQAALERQRKDVQAEQKAEKGWRPCQRPQPSDKSE